MNKPLFKSIRIIQALHPTTQSRRKTHYLLGFFFVAMILLALLAVANILPSAHAESSITKPSVPEFTVKLVDSSYDVPTTYSTDPYTGENVTHPSYHVDNRTIELTIKNQPFVSTNDGGWNTSFYFNVRMKGHYAENWTNVYSPDLGYPTQSNSDYTVISYALDENVYPFWDELSSGAQVDFQVEGMIGYVHRGYNPNTTDQLLMFPWVFDGETSGWSNTQTLTITTSGMSPSPSSSPTSTTTAPQPSGTQTVTLLGLDWTTTALIVLSIVVALLIVVIAFMRRRRVK